MQTHNTKGAILVISGPSGCGKSSLLKELYKEINNYYFSISTTTRGIREGEQDGIDYNFVSKEQFEHDIKDENFLEWAKVHDNYYGTSLKPIMDAVNDGKLVIFDIDVQGHDIVQEKLAHLTTSVFITTPTLSELQHRLDNRNTDTQEVINKRIQNAKLEINALDRYDYFIINDDLKTASSNLISVAKATMLKSKLFSKKELINNWLN
ncbi:MAG: guanylate kinase [Campylobacterota bacterium]|nr:guanylate kinase [Campylobacterota bacterium]